jgi:hypothetical protein
MTPTETLTKVQNSSGVNPASGFSTFSSFAIVAFNVLMGVGVSISIAATAFGLIQIVLSEGDPKKYVKARDSVIWAVAGAIIALGAWSFRQLVLNSLGVTDGNLLNEPTF